MNFVVHDVAQRSPEWHALRCGRLCGSRAADMLATIKTGEAAARRNLRAQLVLERLTGKPQDRTYQSQAMLDGIEREQAALEAYEALSGRLVRSVGFVSHPELMTGASPDGILGEWESFVEVKCPIPATHLDVIRHSVVPDEYRKQMRHLAWLTGMYRGWFVSFHPDFPEHLQLLVLPVAFMAQEIVDHVAAVRGFLAEVDRECEALATLTDLRGTMTAAITA